MRKLLFEEIKPQQGQSFFMLHQKGGCLNHHDFWHFHPEFEIVYVPGGNGKRFIGEHTSNFTNGDLVLLGPNIPHNTFNFGFQSEDYEEYVIQFPQKQIVSVAASFKELNAIQHLLEDATTGQYFTGKAKHEIGSLIKAMVYQKPFQKLMNLLLVLEKMATTGQRKSLNARKYMATTVTSNQRLQKIYAIIRQQYNKEVTTREVASALSMTESSFCRFFQQCTGKSFKTALTEMRIQKACHLLKETDATTTAIAYDCGFNSFSLFNRLFKKLMQTTPTDYRKSHPKKINVGLY